MNIDRFLIIGWIVSASSLLLADLYCPIYVVNQICALFLLVFSGLVFVNWLYNDEEKKGD